MGERWKGGIGKGAFFESEMLLSPAYLSLPKSALIILNIFMLKRKVDKKTHKVLNQYDLTLTYKEIEARTPPC